MISENIDIHAQIPKHLLEQAQKITGVDVELTLRLSLQQLVVQDAKPHIPNVYERLLAMKGKQQFSLSLHELRED